MALSDAWHGVVADLSMTGKARCDVSGWHVAVH